MNTILEHLQKEYVPTYTKEDGETEVYTVRVIIRRKMTFLSNENVNTKEKIRS